MGSLCGRGWAGAVGKGDSLMQAGFVIKDSSGAHGIQIYFHTYLVINRRSLVLLLDPGPSLGRCRGHGWQVRQGQATSSSLPMRSPCSSVAPLASASAPGHLENWGEASGSQGAWPERHRSGWTSMTCGVSTGRAQGQITNLFPEEMTAATGCSHVRLCFQHGACGGRHLTRSGLPGSGRSASLERWDLPGGQPLAGQAREATAAQGCALQGKGRHVGQQTPGLGAACYSSAFPVNVHKFHPCLFQPKPLNVRPPKPSPSQLEPRARKCQGHRESRWAARPVGAQATQKCCAQTHPQKPSVS